MAFSLREVKEMFSKSLSSSFSDDILNAEHVAIADDEQIQTTRDGRLEIDTLNQGRKPVIQIHLCKDH